MLVPAIQAALQAAGVDAHDGEPETTPAGPYAAIYGGTGLAVPHRMNLKPHWVAETARVVLVARTGGGLRALRTLTRATLTGAILDTDFGPLTEQVEGPELKDGPVGDRRLSMTLTYTCHTPREDPS